MTEAKQEATESGTAREIREIDVVIIGAGFSGLYMLYRARDLLHLQVQVFEAGDGPGGTWYWNRYPGARCDSESYYYSYSFSPELEQEWEWSSRYPEQPEILRYLEHVAQRFDLRRNIAFRTRVTAARFEERRNRWRVETDRGDVLLARFLVSAVGCLSSRNVPHFEGLDSFAGAWYHTGAWPHEGVDFSGKRVGIIGTGSTAIQAIPVIAAQAQHLTVFQRTPNFSVPARNAPLEAETTADIKANYADIRQRCRTSDTGFPFIRTQRSAHDVSPEERDAIYARLWEQGGFRFLAESFGDLLLDESSNQTAAAFIRKKIREIVKDAHTAELLQPTDHPYGTKRPPIDTDYYETYNRDNVTLVDVGKAPIVTITPTGLRTTDNTYALDVLVFATGFDAMTGALLNIDIHGVGGYALRDAWADGPRTYLGLQIAGFPNLFTITGPGSPSVLTNMPVAIEQHVEWIADCIAYMHEHGFKRIEATDEAQEQWVKHVSQVAHTTLYPKANSWYVGANVPGKTRVFMPYVGGMGMYRERCDAVVKSDYAGFTLCS